MERQRRQLRLRRGHVPAAAVATSAAAAAAATDERPPPGPAADELEYATPPARRLLEVLENCPLVACSVPLHYVKLRASLGFAKHLFNEARGRLDLPCARVNVYNNLLLLYEWTHQRETFIMRRLCAIHNGPVPDDYLMCNVVEFLRFSPFSFSV